MEKLEFKYYLLPSNYNLKLLTFFSRHDGMSAVFLLMLILFYSPFVAIFILSAPWIEFFLAYIRSEPISEKDKQKILEGMKTEKDFIIRRSETSQCYSLPKLRMITVSKNDYVQAVRTTHSANMSISKAIIAHEIGHLGHYDRMVFLYFKWSIYVIGAYFIYVVLKGFIGFVSGHYEVVPENLYLSVFIAIGLALMWMTLSRISHRREHIADLEGFKIYENGFMNFLNSGLRTEKRSLQTSEERRSRNLFSHPTFESRKSVFKRNIQHANFHTKTVAFSWVFLLLFFYAATRLNGFYPLQIGAFGLFTISFPIVAAMFNLASLNADYYEIKMLIYDYMLGALAACIVVILLDYGYGFIVGESYISPGYYPAYLESFIIAGYLFCRVWAVLLHKLRSID